MIKQNNKSKYAVINMQIIQKKQTEFSTTIKKTMLILLYIPISAPHERDGFLVFNFSVYV